MNLIKKSPALVLLFLAAILGELVSGHQPPLSFFNPISFVLTSLPYGFGALICRELVCKWGKGKFSLLLLATAFGLYEEGIVVRSFFNPNWSELGGLVSFDYFAGVNWIFSIMLIHFHILISIFAGVVLVELMFPKKKKERWLTNKQLIVCIIGLFLWQFAGILMTSYWPKLYYIIIVWVIIAVLIFSAKKVRANPFKKISITPKSPALLFAVGLINMSLIFIIMSTASTWGLPLLVIVLIMITIDALTFILILKITSNGHLATEREKLSLVSGQLAFFIFITAMKDFDGFQGYILSSLLAIILLFAIRKSIIKRENELYSD